jgi:hypothetical protein
MFRTTLAESARGGLNSKRRIDVRLVARLLKRP